MYLTIIMATNRKKCSCTSNGATVIDQQGHKRKYEVPAFKPKYTTLQKISGTFYHIATLGIAYACSSMYRTERYRNVAFPWKQRGKVHNVFSCSWVKVNIAGQSNDGVPFPQVKHSYEVERSLCDDD